MTKTEIQAVKRRIKHAVVSDLPGFARMPATDDASTTDQARDLIDRMLQQHGERSGMAIANLCGVSASTVYKYRRAGSTACRMQLPTFLALAKGAGRVLK